MWDVKRVTMKLYDENGKQFYLNYVGCKVF